MSEQTPEAGQPIPEHLPAPVIAPAADGLPAPMAPVQPAPAPATPVAASPTSSNAIIALVLAIASWVSCPIVLAIVGLVFASKADREIAAGAGRVGGAGLSTAAKVVAWINIGVWLAFLVVGVFILMLAAISGSWS